MQRVRKKTLERNNIDSVALSPLEKPTVDPKLIAVFLISG